MPSSSIQQIFLDLDEVLAAWVEGTCAVWGCTVEQVYSHWQPGTYGIVEPLGKTLYARGRLTDPAAFTEQEFWSLINGRASFWANLHPLPWMEDLVAAVKSLNVPWRLLSKPGPCHSSSDVGKYQWVSKHLGKWAAERLIVLPAGRKKTEFASPGTLLIDDDETNVDGFIAAGGYGLLFPRHHNRLHKRAHEPLEFILNALGLSVTTNGKH